MLRHAGASRVELILAGAAYHLDISLSDNGRVRTGQPSAQAGSGLALAGMAERVAGLGGSLQFTQAAGGGFCLLARLPQHRFTEEVS